MGWLALVGQGVSMLGGAANERKQRRADESYAIDVENAAEEQAQKIRKAGRRAVGQARAAVGASGVAVDSGSPELALEELARESEADAFNTILTGKRQGKAIRQGSKINADMNTVNSASGLLGAAGDYYNSNGGRWIRAGKGG
jgi:hypothetical protein